MLEPKSFLFDVREGVAWVTLNRSERLNALTFEVYRELTDAFAALQDEEGVRVVVLQGAGRAFCSGGDVRDIIGELQGRDAAGLLEFTRLTCALVRNIRALRKPVIASLNGTTAGAGACIALAADLRLASAEARIAFLFVKVGLSGADMGAAHLLPRLVGLAKATELLYTGDFITAEEAHSFGLYNRVVPAAELEAETRALAERLARGPAFALGVTKEMLNREMDVSLDTALEWEAQAQALCMQHSDYREAFEAFMEKREPRFNGNLSEARRPDDEERYPNDER
ncbi:MAG TPA: enoyl-CoA hydratase family protein [Pyrinomonadaceae bacterium]|jgi:enoyl-CoA hydratase/carnithine racemase|nr:enoyl-CoA hydratase family protein [Pyrinomonadaceae bacterium]